MFRATLARTSILLCIFLVACGGGGDAPETTAGATGEEGRPDSGATETSPAPTPAPAFQATLTIAPANDATLCGVHLLEVRGSGMKNVELFPSEVQLATPSAIPGHLNMFTMLENGTLARLWVDVRGRPTGEVRVRVSAFDAPVGQPAQEIVVMAERRWVIANTTPGVIGIAPSCDAPASVLETLERAVGVRPMAASQPQCTRWTINLPVSEPMQCVSVTSQQCKEWTLFDRVPDGRLANPEGLMTSKLACEPAATGGVVQPGCICVE